MVFRLYFLIIFLQRALQVIPDLVSQVLRGGDADKTGVLHGEEFHIEFGNADGTVVLLNI